MNERERMTCENNKKCPLHILSLEDSPMDADLIYEYLCENSRYEIQMDIVLKEEEFVSAISLKKYDLILADFMLPSFNGFAALEHVKSICPSTPFICVSGFIGEETAVELLKRGATDYVLKDKLGRLKYSIERALKESKETEEKEKLAAELIIANKELVFQNKEILYLSYHDSLTGLYNRAFFEEEVKRLEVDRQLPLSVIMGDINGLKLVNDSFGHKFGDKLIIEVAKILKNCCREEDIIARVGGDEFCILLPKSNNETTQNICNRIYKECKEHEKSHKDEMYFISISLGYTTRTIAHESIELIMKEAEASMYKHKLLETRSLRSSIVSSIISTLHERYIETEEHSYRVKELCRATGIALGISDSMLDDLELLSLLHDIGKIAISDSLINKKSDLTNEEWEEMKHHTEIGYHITQSTIEFQQISKYILAHHEKWDGSGYPRQLKGEEIPLLSRIIAVIDAYDAMTNDRPYRKAFSEEEAINELRKNAGTHFDPNIAKVFIEKVLGKEW